ncbi:hypothetical protein M5K25_006915 [Dendrobium thyrsiflorum]|uniref:BZIP domain-containing protein n=1 Tax=Dendrobium thyrsiflorum TaxID=117978 RepID=A0ABD0VJJ4_DENTH
MAASKPESCKNLAAAVLEVTSDPQGQPEDGEGISPLQQVEIAAVFPLLRQSSIYSLTLDEIQNTVCVAGKNFGSMNMDEFLTNIWNVEEGFEASGPAIQAQYPVDGQPPLNRQGSLSLPPQLCRKTVDEVWAEIHGEQQNIDRLNKNNGEATRKPTFGEMTLEDFLIKAGVVREGNRLTAYTMEVGGAPGLGHLYDGGAIGNVRRGGFYCNTGDAGGGLQLGMAVSPASPMSSDGKGGSYGGVDSYGIGMDGIYGKSGCGGRKRMVEGMVEKVVERRQRRMIKNRESAARSRARKQAYTVELEMELNILKEENDRLREEERKVMQIRKRMTFTKCTSDENLRSLAEKDHLNQVSSHTKASQKPKVTLIDEVEDIATISCDGVMVLPSIEDVDQNVRHLNTALVGKVLGLAVLGSSKRLQKYDMLAPTIHMEVEQHQADSTSFVKCQESKKLAFRGWHNS